MSDEKILEELLVKALNEDIGHGDITTLATIDPERIGQARIIARQDGILAGVKTAVIIFRMVDLGLEINAVNQDGDLLKTEDVIMTISGKIASILKGERTVLNFLAHLSGIATLTAAYVERVKGTGAKITDTRKTTPLLRSLEKEAVRAGGGDNHRMGLYDMILIKENHIQAAGGIHQAINKTRNYLKKTGKEVKVEIETTNLDEVKEALCYEIDRIMLDNMDTETMRRAVHIIAGKAEVEASGNVSLETVHSIAMTGVDYISIGALTHSAPVFDFSLLVKGDDIE
jgi:nicotinate-nucleotide pyrophosphorylase (carboxylating)